MGINMAEEKGNKIFVTQSALMKDKVGKSCAVLEK